MARNEEKHVTRLNRLLLQKQREEEEKKNPKRPKLCVLNSASDIQRWIPSIKKEIDFYLKQSQVPCYPARKIEEFNSEIDRLRKEYHAFVRKLREVSPGLGAVPWTERGYGKRKTPNTDEVDTSSPSKLKSIESGLAHSRVSGANPEVTPAFVPIDTPILKKDEHVSKLYGYSKSEGTGKIHSEVIKVSDFDNEPLNFDTIENGPLKFDTVNSDAKAIQLTENTIQCFGKYRGSHSGEVTLGDSSQVLSELSAREVICSESKGADEGSRSTTTCNPLQTLVSAYGGDSSNSDDSSQPDEVT